MDKYEVLKKYFGYDEFRTGQEELIDAVLEGRDVLGIMPTGAGKSICYQVPALILDGITLVISPLISLMMDQVKALNEAGIHAAYINSSLTEGQISRALALASQGRYKIVYVAPERLETDSFLSFASRTPVSMVTVDEAHCISQWGQDFRPSYLKIVRFIESLPNRPVVSAFTATATQVVKDDIICVLGLHNPETLITGFDRENLYFAVKQMKKKDSFLLDYVTGHPGESGIIYCATRKNVDNVCGYLEEMGIDATRYHAGLGSDERKRNQEDFIYDVKPVMVATNAFGMGIDKSNVRYVIHYNMPQSLENYYQEAGRAGRDGGASECIVLYSAQDVVINQFLIENKGDNQEFGQDELELIKENDKARLRAMTGYCTTRKCLREYILNYFGEYTGSQRNAGIHNCGNCSNCLTQFEEVDVSQPAADIIKCVRECGQRYGINVIAGVLKGENRAKIRSYGLTELSTFGLRRDLGEDYLKDIINEMVSEGYLTFSRDKYMLVRLTEKSRELLDGGKLVMKQLPGAGEAGADSSCREALVGSGESRRKQRASDLLTSEGLELLDRLKGIRLEIARREAMPPYIIFSDKTLLDMCIKAPFTKEEMLRVTGVGENKFERFGVSFMDCIREFGRGERRIYYYPDENGRAPVVETGRKAKKTGGPGTASGYNGARAGTAGSEAGGELSDRGYGTGAGSGGSQGGLMPDGDAGGIRGNRRSGSKAEFVLTEEIAEQLHFSEKTTLSDLVGQMNDLRDEISTKRLTNKAILQKLCELGYIEELYENGVWRRVVSPKGADLGIFTEKRVSQAGTEYDVLYYGEKAQHMIVDRLLGDWKYIMQN